jgi:RNA polymerase sigma factor for flagellar operon FliA
VIGSTVSSSAFLGRSGWGDNVANAASNLDVRDAWQRFKSQKDESAREALVLRYAYLVNITAGRVVSNLPPNLDREDLVSAGIVGLIKAVDQFDPERGVKFETYAIALIRGAILEMLREEDWVPRSIRDRAKMLERTYLKLETDLGRPATEKEIAKELGIDLDQLYSMLSETARTAVMSLDELLMGGEGSESGVTVNETVADKGTDTWGKVEKSERTRLLGESVERLPPREKRVIALYYHDGLTFREIGRALDISESRAYQLHTQAIVRMRGYLSQSTAFFRASEQS